MTLVSLPLMPPHEYVDLYSSIRAEVAGLAITGQEWEQIYSSKHGELTEVLDGLINDLDRITMLRSTLENEVGRHGSGTDDHLRKLGETLSTGPVSIRRDVERLARSRQSLLKKQNELSTLVSNVIQSDLKLYAGLEASGFVAQFGLPQTVTPVLSALPTTWPDVPILLVQADAHSDVVQLFRDGELLPWESPDPNNFRTLLYYSSPLVLVKAEATELPALYSELRKKLISGSKEQCTRNTPRVIVVFPFVKKKQQGHLQYGALALYEDRIASIMTVISGKKKSHRMDRGSLDGFHNDVVKSILSVYGLRQPAGEDTASLAARETRAKAKPNQIVTLGIRARSRSTALLRQIKEHNRILTKMKEVLQSFELRVGPKLQEAKLTVDEALSSLHGSLHSSTSVIEELTSRLEAGLSLEPNSEFEASMADCELEQDEEEDHMDIDG